MRLEREKNKRSRGAHRIPRSMRRSSIRNIREGILRKRNPPIHHPLFATPTSIHQHTTTSLTHRGITSPHPLSLPTPRLHAIHARDVQSIKTPSNMTGAHRCQACRWEPFRYLTVAKAISLEHNFRRGKTMHLPRTGSCSLYNWAWSRPSLKLWPLG